MALFDQLLAHLKRFPAAPFLFVGSGLSRRYVGTEDWAGLLQRFAALTDRPYEYFYSKANGRFPETATEIAASFYEKWWADDAYAKSRLANAGIVSHSESPLKIEVAEYIKAKGTSVAEVDALKEEVDWLRKATIDGIITTNWDCFLEAVFPSFQTYIGQDELLFSNPQSVAEIYKIHGSVSKPNSLVLTAADYARFVERNPYLAAKLLTIFVEHPVVILGYALNDDNVLQILDSIASCLSTENIEKLRDRLIFVQWDRDQEGDAMTSTVLSTGGKRLPVTIVRSYSFTPVFKALAAIRRRLPAKVLRQVKEHVYELVRTSDPKGQLYVMDMARDIDPSTVEVVYGIGAIAKLASIGYEGIKRSDLFREVIQDQNRYDGEIVAESLLPRFLANGRVPIYKYLRGAGRFQDNGEFRGEGLDRRIVEAVERGREAVAPYDAYAAKRDEVLACAGGIPGITEKYGVQLALQYIPLLPNDRIDLTQLREFLEENLDWLDNVKPAESTPYRRLACLYDYLRFGPEAAAPAEDIRVEEPG
jgi:hypothetical protein